MRIAQAVVYRDRGRLRIGRRDSRIECRRDRGLGRIQVDVGLNTTSSRAATGRLRLGIGCRGRVEQAQGRQGRRNRAIGVSVVTHQLLTLGIDDVAILVQLKLAVARIEDIAGSILQPEKSTTIDRHVQRVAGHGNVALGKLLSDAGNARPQSNRSCTGAGERRSEDIGKQRRRLLEADRTRVGNIVADRIECGRRRIESTQTLLEAHVLSPITESA